MRFSLVSEDSVPDETVVVLREASRERDIPFEVLTAKTFDFDPSKRLKAGDLLYNAGVSIAASGTNRFCLLRG